MTVAKAAPVVLAEVPAAIPVVVQVTVTSAADALSALIFQELHSVIVLQQR